MTNIYLFINIEPMINHDQYLNDFVAGNGIQFCSDPIDWMDKADEYHEADLNGDFK